MPVSHALILPAVVAGTCSFVLQSACVASRRRGGFGVWFQLHVWFLCLHDGRWCAKDCNEFSLQSFCPGLFLQRKPEEGRVKDTDAKQAKQETTVNGSTDSTASNGNAVQGKSQEASDGLVLWRMSRMALRLITAWSARIACHEVAKTGWFVVVQSGFSSVGER